MGIRRVIHQLAAIALFSNSAWGGAGSVVDDFPGLVQRAERGEAKAQSALARRYLYGDGVDADRTEAHAWSLLAAEQGDAEGQFLLSILHRDHPGSRGDLEASNRWLVLAAEQGHAWAQFYLGLRHEKGEGVPQDDALALAWYQKSAKSGKTVGAQMALAHAYSAGVLGLPKDDREAARWMRLAAEQHQFNAQYEYGMMLSEGRGVAKDPVDAASWLRKAATRGERRAMRALAHAYRDGIGVPKSRVEAYAWMSNATNSGEQGAPAERDEIAAQLDAAELALALQRAREIDFWRGGRQAPAPVADHATN
jgi:uncharacterized protein